MFFLFSDLFCESRSGNLAVASCRSIDRWAWNSLIQLTLHGLCQCTILDNVHQNKIKIKDSHSVLCFGHMVISPLTTPNFYPKCLNKLLPTYFGLQNTDLIFLSWFGYLHQQFTGVDLVVVTRKYIRQLFKQHNSFSRKKPITCSKLFQLHQSHAKHYKVHYFRVSTSKTGYMYIYLWDWKKIVFSIICMKRRCVTLIY